MGASQAMDALSQLCSDPANAGAAGCDKCRDPQSWSACPSPLVQLGGLCQAAPMPSQCFGFARMCAEGGTTFAGLCGNVVRAAAASVLPDGAGEKVNGSSIGGSGDGSGGGSTQEALKMYLHASMSGGWRAERPNIN